MIRLNTSEFSGTMGEFGDTAESYSSLMYVKILRDSRWQQTKRVAFHCLRHAGHAHIFKNNGMLPLPGPYFHRAAF